MLPVDGSALSHMVKLLNVLAFTTEAVCMVNGVLGYEKRPWELLTAGAHQWQFHDPCLVLLILSSGPVLRHFIRQTTTGIL